jgi:hypothetical protein
MRITELFDGNKPWKWRYKGDDQANAIFQVGDIPYRFDATHDPDEAPGDWEIDFQAMKRAKGVSAFGVTGTGNSAEVFGTVVDIMKSFLADKGDRVRRLTFAANEENRQGLYARMVKRLLPGWDLTHYGESFVVTKPGLEFWVHSLEFPELPAVRVKADNSREAEKIAIDTVPQFKNADLMGMVASSRPPKR